MKLLEKLRFQPEWQSDDPSIRLTAVRELSHEAQEVLFAIAKHDADLGVRRAAIGRVTSISALATIAAGDDDTVRLEAAVVLRDRLVDLHEDEVDRQQIDHSLLALTDARDLAAVARRGRIDSLRRGALARVKDEKILGSIARRAEFPEIALEALARIEDIDELSAVAVRAEDKTVALTAFDRLTTTPLNADTLEQIARRAKHKAIVRRAKVELTSLNVPTLDEPSVTEREALCDQLEALTAEDDLERGQVRLDELLQWWATLEGAADSTLSERFATVRLAAESWLVKLDTDQAEARRKVSEQAVALETRVLLCERIEKLVGAKVPEELAALRKALAELPALEPDVVASDDATALFKRIDAADAACERRHTQWLSGIDRLLELDKLIEEIEALLASDPSAESNTDAIMSRWLVFDKTWRGLMAIARVEIDLSDTGSAARLKQLEKRRDAVGERRRALAARAEVEHSRQEQENLARLQKLCNTLNRMVAAENLELGEAKRQLRAARKLLDHPSALPSRRDRDVLTRRLRQSHTALLGRVRELRDFADWERWANLSIQEDLCWRMEALAEIPVTEDVASVAHQFRKLMHRWRQAAQVPKDKSEELWKRFKKAHDAVFPRCEQHFKQQVAEREKNRVHKLALVEEVERLATSTSWINTAKRITQLQAEWKMIGSAPRKEQQELWNRFRAACSSFFARRKAELVQRKQEWAANFEKKDALCARVEALADTDDLAAAIEEVKQSQAEWKTIGPVRRTRSDVVWQRFRTACDGVFQRTHKQEYAAAAEKVKFRETLCAELETLILEAESSGEAPNELVETVQGIQDQWRRASDIPHVLQQRLAVRFGSAILKLIESYPMSFRGAALDPARGLKRLEKLCERVEALIPAASIRGGVDCASPVEILAAQWHETLANNTMGVRVDEAAKRRSAIEEVVRLQAERRGLGQVTGDEGRRLADRFQRACDRVFQQGKPASNQRKAAVSSRRRPKREGPAKQSVPLVPDPWPK